jgi:Tol biopolymer transport system component
MNDLPIRLVSALSGRYTIERKLGEGGMATVYLAHDVRHDRKVALKVLRPELAAVMGAERFLAEIRTTANLRHPHILPLFDSGEAGGLIFYVMPYVRGESLRGRLDRERQLPVDEAVRIATAVAGALEHAHKHGVIHRDIKPANILLEDGEPVVADFGIALAVSHAGGGRITETGLSLGTPYYMSPEQASGEKTLDARSDVYALGCVLYEMLAGDPPYAGSSAQAVLSRILMEEPPHVTEVRRSVPPNVADAVAKALEKIPADRFESAEAFAKALKDSAFRHEMASLATTPIGHRGRSFGPRTAFQYRSQVPQLAMGAVALVASGAAVMGWLREEPADVGQPLMRFHVEVPGGFSATGRQVTISRDGSAVAYPGFGTDGESGIYLRLFPETEPRLIAGTEGGGASPAFSPDGQWIAFVRQDSLFKVSLTGGPARLVTSPAAGASWGHDGFIYFATTGTLLRVPDSGGDAQLLAEPEPGWVYRVPELLPDGSGVLFAAARGVGIQESEIRLLDLETREMRLLATPGTDPTYVATGHILYGHPDGTLMAIPFDLRRHEVGGEPVSVLPSVRVMGGGPTQFDVSANGTAVYQEAADVPSKEIILRSRDGQRESLRIDPGWLAEPRFSPDGRSIAFRRAGQLYVHDRELGTTIQVTREGSNFLPIWSQDGDYITFQSAREGSLRWDGFRQRANGTGEAERLFRLEGNQLPHAWTSDGRLLIQAARGQGEDLMILSVGGDSVDVDPYLTANWDETAPALSKDGRWVAYVSDETGQPEVYVRPFPDRQRGVWPISEGRGLEPVWGPDGGTIYYWSGDALMGAHVQTQPTFSVIERRLVLTEAARGVFPPSEVQRRQFDIHPKDSSFVIVRSQIDASGEITPVRFTVAVNWFQELKQLAPASRN